MEENVTQPRIGILGGTFNPIHMGHLILGQGAMEAFDLQSLLYVPCSMPAHKHPGSTIPGAHRAAMVKLAIEDDLRFAFSDIELQRGGISYAVETVAQLKHQYPHSELCFVIGSDTLPELHMWKEIYILLELCRFVTVHRPGFTNDHLETIDMKLDPPWPERLLADTVTTRLVDISSSDIRHRVAEGMSIRYLVPAAVEMYILEHGLYG